MRIVATYGDRVVPCAEVEAVQFSMHSHKRREESIFAHHASPGPVERSMFNTSDLNNHVWDAKIGCWVRRASRPAKPKRVRAEKVHARRASNAELSALVKAFAK